MIVTYGIGQTRCSLEHYLVYCIRWFSQCNMQVDKSCYCQNKEYFKEQGPNYEKTVQRLFNHTDFLCNNLCSVLKMYTPKIRATKHKASTPFQKVGGRVSLSTHGSTPLLISNSKVITFTHLFLGYISFLNLCRLFSHIGYAARHFKETHLTTLS